MLDKEDLQAIQLMLEAMEQRTDKKLEAMEQRIMQGAAVLMDAEFTKHFKLLSEQQDNVLSHVPNDEDLDIIDGRIADLETIAKQHTREIQQLKKAN